MVASAFGPLCLGGNVFGWTIDEQRSHDVLDAWWERGGTFVDTADIYGALGDVRGAASELIVGRWLADRADDERPVVATKVGCPMPEGEGLSRPYVLDAVERSRERLGVEAIDVLYAHRPDPATPIVETMRAFDELVRGGIVRAIGLSNYDAAQLRAALDACDEHGFARPVIVQPNYNAVVRDDYEGALQGLCVAEGIAVAPYFALASGFLTGKYRRGGTTTPSTPRAAGVLERYATDAGWSVLERVVDIATRHGATPAQVAIAWLRTRDGITAPIASATRVEQVEELVGALDLELDTADLDALGR